MAGLEDALVAGRSGQRNLPIRPLVRTLIDGSRPARWAGLALSRERPN